MFCLQNSGRRRRHPPYQGWCCKSIMDNGMKLLASISSCCQRQLFTPKRLFTRLDLKSSITRYSNGLVHPPTQATDTLANAAEDDVPEMTLSAYSRSAFLTGRHSVPAPSPTAQVRPQEQGVEMDSFVHCRKAEIKATYFYKFSVRTRAVPAVFFLSVSVLLIPN
jgi:hypothetical protein